MNAPTRLRALDLLPKGPAETFLDPVRRKAAGSMPPAPANIV